MDYAIWVYNRIPDMKYGLSATEIWSKLIFEPVQKPLSTVMFGISGIFLGPNLQKPGVNIPKWDPSGQIGVNLVFRKMRSTQVGLIINMLIGSI